MTLTKIGQPSSEAECLLSPKGTLIKCFKKEVEQKAEGEVLKLLSPTGAVPRFLGYTKNAVEMEYLHGYITLQEGLEKAPLAVVKLLPKVARAITVMHALGVYHGDLHTNNVMFNHHGEVRIIDFNKSQITTSSKIKRYDAQLLYSYLLPFLGVEARILLKEYDSIS